MLQRLKCVIFFLKKNVIFFVVETKSVILNINVEHLLNWPL